jgi:hypothetical protein
VAEIEGAAALFTALGNGTRARPDSTLAELRRFGVGGNRNLSDNSADVAAEDGT